MTKKSKLGIRAVGRKEYEKYLSGEKLTHKQITYARCFFCMNGYYDGKVSCEAPDCPNFQIMPYRKIKWD
tara:strand:- start:56 stop:265 length:210 start_codon:yes stop_codon:yes gene_type:complete